VRNQTFVEELPQLVAHPATDQGEALPQRKLRIAIATSGRFHVLDLARELAELGHSVRFYSIVPPWRTRKFGLPAHCNIWLLPRISLQYGLMRASHKTRWKEHTEQRFAEALDRAIAIALQPCDVFIGMSGFCNRSTQVAKQKYGAKIIIERGSTHILSQQEILAAIPGAQQVPNFAVQRELHDYAQADIISVLSQHCAESFLERGFPYSKLMRTLPGVDLRMFPPTPAPPAEPPTILMAGSWSMQKGCDVLLQAWRQLPGVKLLHVGSVADVPLPRESLFEHVATVDQSQLSQFYARAQVCVLASRQEGMGIVLLQALASGLRIVCTDRTGGTDMKPLLNDPYAIRLVHADDAMSLAEALRAALADCQSETGLRDRLGPVREQVTWTAYAQRYETELLHRMLA